MKCFFCLLGLILFISNAYTQQFTFNFNSTGQRVCLADAAVDTITPSATIYFRDAQYNTNRTTSVYRRQPNGLGSDWIQVATALPAGTASWTDYNVSKGEVWEYQIKRNNGSTEATGYTTASIAADQTSYRGRIVLLLASNIDNLLPEKINILIKDLTGDGWYVQKLVVPRANGWNSGDTVIGIRNQLISIYNNAPANDKPKLLFILGHVPLPRSGVGGQTPDDHPVNAGARGADTYYADLDGTFTDTATFNPGGLSTPLAINLPGDFKWDQDFIPTSLEMGFGRIDFADISSFSQGEIALTSLYLDRLHNYKHVAQGWYMGNKTAFNFGFNNSNDGSYRSLPAISRADSLFQNTTSLPHPQWVSENGPFMVYMQNQFQPSIPEWNTYGMNATVFSSDQSYWGFGDVPESYNYSKIRALLAANTRCLMAIWTTMAINIFHQPGCGESMGIACKQIMEHNTTNQKLEKPTQQYDTPAFWNRTQFELYGDPSLRLFQVYPASNPTISGTGNSAIISWTASIDSRVIGYQVYKSDTEFGIFQKISGPAPLVGTSFADFTYSKGNWYMIKAVIWQKSGSGIFLNSSQGLFIEGTFDLLSQPGNINGNNPVCQGSEQTYSVSPVPGATFYNWTIPPGWSGNSSGNSITTTVGNAGGSISVSAHNQNGNSTPSSLLVDVNTLPTQAGAISGNTSVCETSTQTYQIEPIPGATSYEWIIPASWSGTSDSTSITVQSGWLSGTISVAAMNACGSGVPASIYIYSTSLPQAAGSIVGTQQVCNGQTSVIYSIEPIMNATSYSWMPPAGATAIGNSTSTEIDFSSSAISGLLTVAGVNDCGQGTQSSFFITVNPVPETPLVERNGTLLTSNNTSGNQWYKNNVMISGANEPSYLVTENGLYSVVVTINDCSSAFSEAIEVIITDNPETISETKFLLSPNPVETMLRIQSNQILTNKKYKIINSCGVEVQGALLPENMIIDVHTLPAGFYSLQWNAEGKSISMKFIKK